MKKIGLCLIITLTVLFTLALSTEAPKASQEAAKEASQGAQAAQSEPSHGTLKTKEPFDSIQVIPKGPEWLGAPLMPNGTKVREGGGRLTFEYNLPYNEVLAWYKEALKDYPDKRYRDWKEEMYIEDQGASRWHAIKISKTGGPKSEVTIVKDNWTWILATLVIRFTGVFVVLLVLWIGLNIATAILLRVVKEEKKTPTPATGG